MLVKPQPSDTLVNIFRRRSSAVPRTVYAARCLSKGRDSHCCQRGQVQHSHHRVLPDGNLGDVVDIRVFVGKVGSHTFDRGTALGCPLPLSVARHSANILAGVLSHR
jgi:hypothetical protein